MPLQQCEYLLLRYAPDLVKDEHVNFGLLMFDTGGQGFAAVRFARDLRRVQCLSPNADLEMLNALEADLRRRIAVVQDRDELLRAIQSSFSGNIQVSEMRACQTKSPQQELEELARIYLEPAPAAVERRAVEARGRTLIRRRMRHEFESAGVADLMFWDLLAARYTQPGDPLKLDCGYRPNGVVKLFQAVSLRGELESAKALVFSVPRIAQGIQRQEKAEARFTAIVEDHLDRSAAPVAFALNAFAESNVAVAAVADLPGLAAVARKELRV